MASIVAQMASDPFHHTSLSSIAQLPISSRDNSTAVSTTEKNCSEDTHCGLEAAIQQSSECLQDNGHDMTSNHSTVSTFKVEPRAASDAWKSILAKYSVKEEVPLNPVSTNHEFVCSAQSSYASAIPALARQHAAKLAATPVTQNDESMSSYPPNAVPVSNQSLIGSSRMHAPAMTPPMTQVSHPQQGQAQPIYNSSPSTTLAAAAHLATMGVGVGPGINPNIANPAGGLCGSPSAGSSNPPIVNTGNNGPMYVQPGDWVCSSCGFVNWRRRRVCMRCYPFADQNEVSNKIAQGAVLAAQLAAGLKLSQEAISSLTQPRKSSSIPAPASDASGNIPLMSNTPATTTVRSASVPYAAQDTCYRTPYMKQQALDFSAPSPSASPQVWQSSSPKLTPGSLGGTHMTGAEYSIRNRMMSNQGRGLTQPDIFGSGGVLMQRSFATPGHAPSPASLSPYVAQERTHFHTGTYTSAQLSPALVSRRYAGGLTPDNAAEYPWATGSSIWSTPATPDYFSGKTFNSPTDASSIPRSRNESSSAFGCGGAGNGSSSDDATSRLGSINDAAPSTPSTSVAATNAETRVYGSVPEAHTAALRSGSQSSRHSFVDENDEIIKPVSKTARRSGTSRSSSPSSQINDHVDLFGLGLGLGLGLSLSDETPYQPSAIEPPCRAASTLSPMKTSASKALIELKKQSSP